jgi:hypothetical protein
MCQHRDFAPTKNNSPAVSTNSAHLLCASFLARHPSGARRCTLISSGSPTSRRAGNVSRTRSVAPFSSVVPLRTSLANFSLRRSGKLFQKIHPNIYHAFRCPMHNQFYSSHFVVCRARRRSARAYSGAQPPWRPASGAKTFAFQPGDIGPSRWHCPQDDRPSPRRGLASWKHRFGKGNDHVAPKDPLIPRGPQAELDI